MKRVFVLSILALLILSSFVLAAGFSSRDNNEEKKVNCEDGKTVGERVKCRFDHPEAGDKKPYGTVEEACRDSPRQAACQALYARSGHCYDDVTNAAEKRKCFLKEAGLNDGGKFRAATSEVKRNYVVLLLYHLQERIEAMQESGKLTADEATNLVTEIIEIKKMIIAGEPRSAIVPNIQEFKKDYKEAVA